MKYADFNPSSNKPRFRYKFRNALDSKGIKTIWYPYPLEINKKEDHF